MRKVAVLLAIAALVSACYQTSDPKVNQKKTPNPNAQDGVIIPDDVTQWQGNCNVADDCDDSQAGPCEKVTCLQGECQFVPVAPGSICADDTLSTEECMVGVCMADGETLKCASQTAPDGTPCGDFHPACGVAGGCKAGICLDPCNDGNPCTAGVCKADGCDISLTTNACDDGNACTDEDVCAEGVCAGVASCECKTDSDCNYLDDGDPCTGTYVCKSNGKCIINKSTVIECPETGDEPCSEYLCNPKSGSCDFFVADDGSECDDDNTCTSGNTCMEGACTGIDEILCEYLCDDNEDDDDDGTTDCDDPDCWGVGECPEPECGDETCQELPPAEETCLSCPEDCGECPAECSDSKLQTDTGEECDDGNLDPGDGCDELCKVEPVAADPGDIIITELMKNPAAVEDADGEWFEIYNSTDEDININAWTITDADDDDHRIYTQDGTIVPATSYYLLGNNGATDTNGGVTIDYVYTGVILANNATDELILSSGATVVDQVVFDDGETFPDSSGKSLSLSASKLDEVMNDDGANWCDGMDDYGMTDLGTPGAANPECPFCGDNECNADENCETCEGDCACEMGFLCVDGNCLELTEAGEFCGSNADCKSGFCADTVCCDTACEGGCESCNLSNTEGTCTPHIMDSDPEDFCGECTACDGSGACANVAIDTDLLEDCTKEAESTCGLSGVCDGNGACAKWPQGTECEVVVCNGSTLNLAGTCGDTGACEDGGTQDCLTYQCNDTNNACLTACVTSDDCVAPATCDINDECTE
jgi:hypothetical protein